MCGWSHTRETIDLEGIEQGEISFVETGIFSPYQRANAMVFP